MTPYQGDSPNEPRGRQPSGSEYQQPPTRQPQQPPGGQYQGQSPQQGQPVQQGSPSQRGQPTQQGQPAQQPQQGQPQPRQQYQGSTPQGRTPQGPPQQQSGGMQTGMPQQGAQAQPGGGMQSPQIAAQHQQTAQFGQQPGMRPQRGGGPQLRPIKVEEIIETDVVTAQRDTPIATVVAKMSNEDVGSVVVVENDQPVGIITDRKVALALENTPDIANKQAGDLISGDLITGTTEMSVFDVLDQFSDEGVRRLPIVDDDSTLQGIVSLDDILVLLGSELNKAAETISAQASRL